MHVHDTCRHHSLRRPHTCNGPLHPQPTTRTWCFHHRHHRHHRLARPVRGLELRRILQRFHGHASAPDPCPWHSLDRNRYPHRQSHDQERTDRDRTTATHRLSVIQVRCRDLPLPALPWRQSSSTHDAGGKELRCVDRTHGARCCSAIHQPSPPNMDHHLEHCRHPAVSERRRPCPTCSANTISTYHNQPTFDPCCFLPVHLAARFPSSDRLPWPHPIIEAAIHLAEDIVALFRTFALPDHGQAHPSGRLAQLVQSVRFTRERSQVQIL